MMFHIHFFIIYLQIYLKNTHCQVYVCRQILIEIKNAGSHEDQSAFRQESEKINLIAINWLLPLIIIG